MDVGSIMNIGEDMKNEIEERAGKVESFLFCALGVNAKSEEGLSVKLSNLAFRVDPFEQN